MKHEYERANKKGPWHILRGRGQSNLAEKEEVKTRYVKK